MTGNVRLFQAKALSVAAETTPTALVLVNNIIRSPAFGPATRISSNNTCQQGDG